MMNWDAVIASLVKEADKCCRTGCNEAGTALYAFARSLESGMPTMTEMVEAGTWARATKEQKNAARDRGIQRRVGMS